jgi:predicted amidophosphoribosyltransferase
LNRRTLLNRAIFGTTTVAQGLFAALFPSECRICASPLLNISRLPVCTSCLLAMHPIAGPTCDLCGEKLSGWQGSSETQVCSACQEMHPSFSKAAAYGAYQGELRDLIHLLKYERVLPAADALGRMLAEAIGKLDFAGKPVLVVPVPLHAAKKRHREFNQAELIARAAIKALRAPSRSWWSIRFLTTQDTGAAGSLLYLETEVLVRDRATVSQIGLTRPQRRENIRGAFRVAHPSRVAGRSILLVDDVLTTGTTASECARVLLKAGADKVMVATVARTLKETDAILQVEPELGNVAHAS